MLTRGADDSVFSRALISGHGLGFLVALLSWASQFTVNPLLDLKCRDSGKNASHGAGKD